MIREWATTTVFAVDPEDPVPPSGIGWRLIGVASAFTATRRGYDNIEDPRIALFWERDIEEPPSPPAAWTADQLKRPCMLLRPRIYIDGNQWCALYGDNIQDGVAGFGDSPAEAFDAFDAAWVKKL